MNAQTTYYAAPIIPQVTVSNHSDYYRAVTSQNTNLTIPTITSDKDYTIWEAIRDAYKNEENIDLLNLFGKHSLTAFSEYLCENAPHQYFNGEELYNYVIGIEHGINSGTYKNDTSEFDGAMEFIGELLNVCLAKANRWQVCLVLYHYNPQSNQVNVKSYQNAANDKYLMLHIFELAPRTQTTRAKFAAFDVKNPAKIFEKRGPPQPVAQQVTVSAAPIIPVPTAVTKPTFGVTQVTQAPTPTLSGRVPQSTLPPQVPNTFVQAAPPTQPFAFTQQPYSYPQPVQAQQTTYTVQPPPQQVQQTTYTQPLPQLTQQYGPPPTQWGTQPASYYAPPQPAPVTTPVNAIAKMSPFWNAKK
ncbi:hypothetical protein BNJ_00099 [Kaumoebavirus]|uniref:hypothetical protein n=1 Tax=Kaumoebavirus TaxID=1859492 RepID=UPI0009C2802C|nr:hypothetical protein BNJ_00099 [Kaumoebavirus]ARA71937.1 hypothetical protein BNJ_00099 [Kaumoebavirus]